MSSRCLEHRAPLARDPASDPWACLLRRRGPFSPLMEGHHNRNYLLPLTPALAQGCHLAPYTPVKARVPIPGALRFDPHTWEGEEELLRRLGRLNTWRNRIPRVLHIADRFAVHTYAEGDTLHALRPTGATVPQPHLRSVIGLFPRLAQVPLGVLPETPQGWPSPGDSGGFLRTLLRFTHDRVYRPHLERFRELFGALGIREDVVWQVGEAAGTLTPRPFVLLHGDLHRRNLIVRPSGELFVIDWELALVGDPVYELATHLCRMEYPRWQWRHVVAMWCDSLRAVSPALVADAGRDLAHYLRYKRMQSVLTDVVRGAASLAAGSRHHRSERSGRADGAGQVERVAATVRKVLLEAGATLGSGRVPSVERISRAFETWRRNQGASTCRCAAEGSHDL